MTIDIPISMPEVSLGSGRIADGRSCAAACAKGCAKAVGSGNHAMALRWCQQLSDDLRVVSATRLWELTEVPAPLTGDSRYDAMIAAVVESVCDGAWVRVPAWVEEKTRACAKWYVRDARSLREEADRTSPLAFRRRGVFVLPSEFERY